MTLIEIVATAFGLACVWLYVRENVWSWPTGLVQVILFAWVFYNARLYSDFLLHLIYIVLQVYGWVQWTRRREDAGATVQIRSWGTERFAAWLGAGVPATLLVGFLMKRYADAAVPYWDAGIAVYSLIATYLLAKKVLENWVVWVAVDVVAVGVYFSRELYVTTGLYLVFLGMAVTGWFAWRKELVRRFEDADRAAASSSGSSSRLTAAISSSSSSPGNTSNT